HGPEPDGRGGHRARSRRAERGGPGSFLCADPRRPGGRAGMVVLPPGLRAGVGDRALRAFRATRAARAARGARGARAALALPGQLRGRPAVPPAGRGRGPVAARARQQSAARRRGAARSAGGRLRGGAAMTGEGGGPGSAALFARALEVTPGGVNSPVRAFGSVGGRPGFMASGRGPYLTGVDGREYVDLVCSWGPMILGHAHPAVTGAVAAALSGGTSFGTVTPGEVELAEELVGRAPVEKVRLVSSGTEATMSALRLARGVSGGRRVEELAGRY